MPDIMEIGKNPNYLGSYDLYDLNTPEITVTIKKFAEEEVTTNSKTEKCAVMYFEENYKPMIVNPTNKKRLAKLFKTKMSEKMVGKRITIYIEKVKAFGKIHDALRIKETLPTTKTDMIFNCENCNGIISAAGKMSAEQTAAYTKNKYGRALCVACATTESKKNEGSAE